MRSIWSCSKTSLSGRITRQITFVRRRVPLQQQSLIARIPELVQIPNNLGGFAELTKYCNDFKVLSRIQKQVENDLKTIGYEYGQHSIQYLIGNRCLIIIFLLSAYFAVCSLPWRLLVFSPIRVRLVSIWRASIISICWPVSTKQIMGKSTALFSTPCELSWINKSTVAIRGRCRTQLHRFHGALPIGHPPRIAHTN